MNLPVPSTAELAAFKDLYLNKRGVQLHDMQVLELATQYLQCYYFGVTSPASDSNTASASSEMTTAG